MNKDFINSKDIVENFKDNKDCFDSKTLEFHTFCNKVAETFVSSYAKQMFKGLYPCSTKGEAIGMQEDLKECFSLLNSAKDNLSLLNDSNFYLRFTEIFSESIVHMSLSPDDYMLLASQIDYMHSIKLYFSQSRQEGRLSRFYNLINPDLQLAKKIYATFEENGDVKDDATAELFSISKRLNEHRSRVRQQLNGILNRHDSNKFIQEDIIVVRNGRYTLACKTNFSQYINAIIHDRSSSGLTVYVEPTVCIPLNNEIQEDLSLRNKEIKRILDGLLKQFKEGIDNLNISLEAYSSLLMRMETALFYSESDFTFPVFSDEINLQKIHHPLIKLSKREDSVALDIKVDSYQSLVVISGPNTGGKTAALKSVGLNHIIAMCGLPIFAKEANMRFFNKIFADIGDNQSIVMDLSTFSSHMINILKMIELSDSNTLLLFDELGTGTDPKEGASLAISILNYINERGGCVFVTTHFTDLKTYAYERNDAKQYAVNFDYETFNPCYNLLEGVSGKSDPIIIAKRLGFPTAITEMAEELVNKNKSSLEASLDDLNLMRTELENKLQDLNNREEELKDRQHRIDSLDKELTEKLNSKEILLLEESYSLLQRAKRLANSGKKIKPENIDEALTKVVTKLENSKSLLKPVENINVGDTIYLDKYSKTGKILSMDKTTVYIDLEGIKVRLKRSELIGEKINKEKKSTFKVSQNITSQVKYELVLVGKRVDEALDILEKYLDNAVISGYPKIYIVHGRGTGQLRDAVRNYLRNYPKIDSFSSGDFNEGGDAITVVKL